MINRIGDCGRHPDQGELANSLDSERIHVGIALVDEIRVERS